jgi:hypothetical protein
MDLSGGVAVRIAALCLDMRGRASEKVICGDAVRGGLLLDLGLAGRVESADDSVVVDSTPTGFEPADRLLAAITVEPERSLDGWLGETRIGLRDVADAAVASGRWAQRRGPWGLGRRYTDLRPDETVDDLRRRSGAGALDLAPADACVAAVASASGLLDREFWLPERPDDALLLATGSVGWLVAAVVDHLDHASARYRAQAGALQASGPF